MWGCTSIISLDLGFGINLVTLGGRLVGVWLASSEVTTVMVISEGFAYPVYWSFGVVAVRIVIG